MKLTRHSLLKTTALTRAFALTSIILLAFGCAPGARQDAVIVEESVPASLSEAFAAAAVGDHRSAANIARNPYRHPVETLEFFGIKPGKTVMEISPGGMWYTEVLAPALKGRGNFVVAGYDTSISGQPEYRYRQQAAMEKRFSEQPEHYAGVSIVKFSPPDSVALGEDNSVDVVVTFRNFHGWLRGGIAESNLQAFFDVLKPGGTLGLVQHRTDRMAKLPTGRINGYVTEQVVIELAESVGFELEAKSEINANPKDSRDHPAGVWTLPPSLRLGEQDKDKYLAIGESDRMTLRFKKPG